MSLAILFHFLCTQHVSDINISIIRSFRLSCWITTSVVLFSVRCVLEIWCGWCWVKPEAQELYFSLQNEHQNQPHQISNTQRTENKTTDVVIQQHSRKLLMMDILMSETCWAHKKWKKIASDIKLVFHSATITMMRGPINIRSITIFYLEMKPAETVELGAFVASSSSSVICQTTGPKPLPKRFLHIVRYRASSFNWQYSLLSLRSSSSFLRLLPRLLITSICPFIFIFVACDYLINEVKQIF